MTGARSFELHGTPLPLSAAALRAIAAIMPIVPDPAEMRQRLDRLLARDFVGGFTMAQFEALPQMRQREVMTTVHQASLAGLQRHPE